MPTLDDLAKEYANVIRVSKKSQTGLERLSERIAALKYTKTGKPISNADLNELFDMIRSKLQNDPVKEINVVFESEDFSAMLDLLEKVRQAVKEAKR